ncbi:fungal-specific transcription factor domain-containing protein [Amylostereum chailletii]|nr:fungal-specific transcription factor domain-containing protein [Amylostereum chailletii]
MNPSSSSKGKEKADEPQKQRRRPGRVPVSCAECRRLKLRCDRKMLQGSVRDMYQAGMRRDLSKRYVLANTTELHARIDRMTRRIRELEHGLGSLQATVSDDTHPLLRDGTDPSNSPPVPEPPAVAFSTSTTPSAPNDEFIDAFGTLSIGSQGEARFYGSTARGEATLENSKPGFWDCTRLDERILAVPFPEATTDQIAPEVRDLVLCHLPLLDEAQRLCELFLEHATYIPSSMSREQLLRDVVGAVYHSKTYERAPPPSHALALLFITIAITKLLVPASKDDVEAYEFFVLARVALTFDSPIVTTTVMSVQVMCYMAQFLQMRDVSLVPTGCSRAWMYLGLAVQMGHSIGLHVNASRFRLGENESGYRSRVFWHLFAVDTWTSFTFGRPPSTNLNFVDCDLPPDTEIFIEPNGAQSMGFARWSNLFSQLLHHVLSTAFAAKPPRYSTILELDQKLREFAVPEYLRAESGVPEQPGTYLVLKRWLVLSQKEWALLNIHRAYFAQALRERPLDPVKHKFGASVMALFRAAYRIVEASRLAMARAPEMFRTSNLATSKVLSAAIVMCLLVCTAASSNLAPASMEVLEKALAVVEHGVNDENTSATENVRQAREVMARREVQSGGPPLTAEELDRLCGATHTITAGSSTFTSTSTSTPVASLSASSSPSPGPPVRRTRTPMSVDNLLNDYANVVPPAPPLHFADFEAYPGGGAVGAPAALPLGTGGVSVYEVGYSPWAAQGQSGFGGAEPLVGGLAPGEDVHDPFGMVELGLPFVLDASWQDFVQQLGF